MPILSDTSSRKILIVFHLAGVQVERCKHPSKKRNKKRAKESSAPRTVVLSAILESKVV